MSTEYLDNLFPSPAPQRGQQGYRFVVKPNTTLTRETRMDYQEDRGAYMTPPRCGSSQSMVPVSNSIESWAQSPLPKTELTAQSDAVDDWSPGELMPIFA